MQTFEELNEQLPDRQQIPLSTEAIIFGEGGKLDSLGLVNLVLLVEERISDELGYEIAIADEKAVSQKDSPFRSAQTLAEYINQLLQELPNA